MSRRLSYLALLLCVGLALAGCGPVGLLVDSSPDGQRLAFTWRSADYRGLALINLDGTGFRWVPDGDNGQYPLWSPDGRSILFSVETGGSLSLFLHDLASGKTRQVAEGVVAVAWRADGQLIAGVRETEGRPEVVWLTPSGSVVSAVPLPTGVSIDTFPTFAWLPATDTVAFMAGGGAGEDLFLAHPDGVRQVSYTYDVAGFGLAPDGRRLLWARSPEGRRGGLFLLYTYDWVTGSSMRLPFPSALTMLRPDPGFAPSRVWYASFAPGAPRLVLLVVFTGPARLNETTSQTYTGAYTLNLDGSAPHLLRRTAPTPGNDPQFLIPWWARDGRRIVVLAGCPTEGREEGRAQLLVYSADGTRGRTLLSVPCENAEVDVP